jgi:hypothetical protein
MSSNNVKSILAAIANASKTVKALPPAPTFDPAPIRAAFEAANLPTKFIDSALAESERKFIATHGDNGERIARSVIQDIAESLGGLDEFARIAGRMASEARKEGKVNVTGAEWRAAAEGDKEAKPEHVSLLEKASDLRKDGKPWSEIQTLLGLSDAARSQLYTVARDYSDLFPVKE